MNATITRYGASLPNCPLCGALPGDSCRTSSGRSTSDHKSRTAAREAYSATESAYYAAELARVAEEVEVSTLETAETPAKAIVSAHLAECSCGVNNSLMNGQAAVTCSCGATYVIPELDYLEVVTVSAVEVEEYVNNYGVMAIDVDGKCVSALDDMSLDYATEYARKMNINHPWNWGYKVFDMND